MLIMKRWAVNFVFQISFFFFHFLQGKTSVKWKDFLFLSYKFLFYYFFFVILFFVDSYDFIRWINFTFIFNEILFLFFYLILKKFCCFVIESHLVVVESYFVFWTLFFCWILFFLSNLIKHTFVQWCYHRLCVVLIQCCVLLALHWIALEFAELQYQAAESSAES